MTKFTCQCTRCDSTGLFDRGTCFDCKGLVYANRTTTTRGLTPFVLDVTFANGSENTPRVFAATRAKAAAIVMRICAIKGWEATVA